MPGRVVLHVGAMKSGTTYLQSRLFANKPVLRERGILLPGKHWRSQVYAVQQLLRGGGPRWEKHARAVSAHEGTSVVSMEFLGPVRPAVARRVREDLAGDLEVVVSVRDLNRSIAAMWQETVQNGHTWTWQDYLDGVRTHRPGHRDADAPAPPAGRNFWRQQDVVRIARTWAGVVGGDRVTVLTVPHPGAPRELLWERFASVLGTSADGFAPAPEQNESLGAASALAVRRLNELLAEQGLPFPEGMAVRKGLLCKELLARRRSSEPALGLPVADWVREQAAGTVAGLQALGVALVGDWGDLEPVPVAGVACDEVPEHEVAEAALAGMAGLLAERIRADAG